MKKRIASIPNDKVMGQLFAEDQEFVHASLSPALEEGNMEELLILMRQLAESCGGIPAVAQKTGLHEKSLYRTLSPRGNPRFSTVWSLLSAMKIKLVAEPITEG